MDYVIYDGKKYKVDNYKRLILSGLDIEEISQIEGLYKTEVVETLSLYMNKISEIFFQ